MALPIPQFSLWGVMEYMAFALGFTVGWQLFSPAMSQIESLIANLRNGA